ncbi:LysR family transcriptional regulator [Paeniglutamicibacter psychrophenolicus]|uniref:DNA-binding transcriptional LysR family regulator n=1 Tax=Paeniglutamicibacter psychrophenolicus TaxID=257454 RepID=A0ABS4WAA0_9MICC|nr:LysR family transcriptional regulator [Paeniglutamicibacter psychrophenolicus]MBP2373105.1 DNA-binding transcriptional LysR family regulator [Paeniglutamicibacter psychrophenolicus]
MEIRQFEAFLAVAQELHFGRAAENLVMAQPALSRMIRMLEKELGTELFERTTRKVRLTPSGEALLEPAKAIHDQVDGIKRIARSAQQGEIGSVKVGFAGTTGYSILSALARSVSRGHPGISLALQPQMYSGEALSKLRDGEIDLGVVSSPAPLGISTLLVSNETLMVAVPADHELAAGEKIGIQELRDQRFIAYPATHGSRVRDAMISICTAAGFVPHIAQEAPDPYSLLALVGAGVGVSIVVGSSRHIQVDGVTYRPLIDAGMVLPIALAWRDTNPSLALRTVVALAKEAFPAQVAGH